MIADRPVRDFFSFKSPSFRKLGLDLDSLTDEQMLTMMLDEPRLIRRPILVVGDRVIVGHDEAAYRQALG